MPQSQPQLGRAKAIFGPLLYGTLALALVVILSLVLWRAWPSLWQSWEVRTLTRQLRDPDPLVGGHAAYQLAELGTAAIPALVDAARDRNARVRRLAFTELGRITPAPKAAISALVFGLRDSDSRIRRQAADALARFGPEVGKGADALAEALADPVPDIRFRAARALSRIERQANEPVVQVLLALVASPVATRLKPFVPSATPLSDTRPPDRFDVVEVIRRLGDERESRAVSALIPLTVADDPSVRREAAECLGLFGPRARRAVPELERALGDEDPVLRCLSALALSEIEGWEKGRARTLLGELVDSPSLPPGSRPQVRWVLQSDLVAGSEISQPVHVLRALVGEYCQAEKMTALGLSPHSGADTPNPE